jgi:hypothetical protein
MKDLISDFNKLRENIKPMIVYNFGLRCWENICKLADEKNERKLYSELNEVWFCLPDNEYNIMKNPAGFNDLLYLVER